MEGRRFIESIRLDRILSFGPNDEAFGLEPLNVLIGPNASGKSNLIATLSVLHAAPRDVQAPIREGGGVPEWLWKGAHKSTMATINVTLNYPMFFKSMGMSIRYRLDFAEVGGRFFVFEEAIEREKLVNLPAMQTPTLGVPLPRREDSTSEENEPEIFYQNGFLKKPLIDAVTMVEGQSHRHKIGLDDVKSDQSILSQRQDPRSYPELTYVGSNFQNMTFYREWQLGRFSPARQPQRTDLQQDRLLEDASNLGLVLNYLQNQPALKSQLLERMREFYPFIEDIHTNLIGGTVQIFFHEKGLREAIPASRLSDGSLRYLCLLAVLLHPEPPNVICIEEPELGLHPDIIPEVAKLLIEASKRSQIFVTTHSDVLVDALSEVPEAVVVCEKVDGATQLRRLDKESLEPWLEKYRLGELWTSGRFGGNRW